MSAPIPPASTSSTVLPSETIDALQKALATEHAAVWLYGLVSAFLPRSFNLALSNGMSAHTTSRDATDRLVRNAGATPVPSEIAYQTPQAVTNQSSALAALIAAESDAAKAWHSVLEYTSDQDIRKAASATLTDCALRGARWNKAAGQPLSIPALPGQG